MDLYGIIGWPVTHSLSPAMHNAAFKKLGIDAEYRLFPVKAEELEDFLLNRKDVKGFNVTIPHKVRAKEILEKNFPSSEKASIKLAGAINTVKREGEILKYLNTDVHGFSKALKEDLGFDASGKEVILFGCGGAARAIIASLATEWAVRKIYIFDNDKEILNRAQRHFLQLKDKLEFISDRDIVNAVKNTQLLVNATPVGMEKGDDRAIIEKKLLHKDLFIYDLVYNRETKLLKDARSLGLRASGGLGMLLYQGAHAFEFWTDQRAPIGVMRKALERAIT